MENNLDNQAFTVVINAPGYTVNIEDMADEIHCKFSCPQTPQVIATTQVLLRSSRPMICIVL